MDILRAATHKRMPWKNGGGETVEIAVFPKTSTLGDFDWRVSMATVATDGPFSIFERIDRTLSILTGDGMSLAIDGREPVMLTTASEPLAFAADVAVSATLPGSAITDLNVMTRRGRLVHDVERLAVEGAKNVHVQPGTVLLLCRDGSIACCHAGEETALEHDDALLFQIDSETSLSLSGRATCYLIRIYTA